MVHTSNSELLTFCISNDSVNKATLMCNMHGSIHTSAECTERRCRDSHYIPKCFCSSWSLRIRCVAHSTDKPHTGSLNLGKSELSACPLPKSLLQPSGQFDASLTHYYTRLLLFGWNLQKILFTEVRFFTNHHYVVQGHLILFTTPSFVDCS